MCASAGDISASEKVSTRYITAMIPVASSMLPKPFASPRFHPEKCPEITAPTLNGFCDYAGYSDAAQCRLAPYNDGALGSVHAVGTGTGNSGPVRRRDKRPT